jgi:methyl-accepting chemotaxis protein
LASKEQTAGFEQINDAIQQLNTITQKNAGSAEVIGQWASKLPGQARKLNELAAYF